MNQKKDPKTKTVLSDLQTGEKGVVVKVVGHGGFRKRIVEMGFIKGKTVEVLMNAPLKDPVKYKIMGYELSLRRQEAEMIEVLSEEEAAREKTVPQFHGSINKEEQLSEKDLQKIALGRRRTINVALVGNPNCGKTSLFNIASGLHERVGNYSGVTVDAKEGFFDFEGYHFRIVDLPGTYSLSAYTPEERYVRRHILEELPDVVINVVDASNLERNLYLTTQLVDMNVRTVVALNMYDELQKSGNELDYCLLSQFFGIPMVPTICKKKKGINTLFHIIINMYEGADFLDENGIINPEIAQYLKEWHQKYVDEKQHEKHLVDYVDSLESKNVCRHIHINHGTELENAIHQIKSEIARNKELRHRFSTRFLAIKLLENDSEVEKIVSLLPNGKEIFLLKAKEQKKIQATLNEESESAIVDAKYGFISGALKETLTESIVEKKQISKAIDALVMHRIWGYPIFLLFLFLMFQSTFVLGAYPMTWIEQMVDALNILVRANMTEGILKELLTDGIISGVGGVIVFLPNILILFFCISIMEDSGYMARAAFLMDKIMHKIGLHGKSFIPLLMGFGCNVPAVMATRTLESHKSRLVTMLSIPLMSCSARLPVYLVLTTSFFPRHGGYVITFIYMLSISATFLSARFFSKHLVKQKDTPFVMELPPYRMPTIKAISRHTWEKGSQYLKKMGGIILVASIVIWFLGYFPNHNSYEGSNEQQEHSYIGKIGKVIEPTIQPLGFDWKMGIGILSGIGAKELIVSTLSVIYSDSENSVALGDRLPITPLAALSYMIFILFYFPCIATLAAIRQESGGWKWVFFSICYTTALAWLLSFVVYQIGSLL